MRDSILGETEQQRIIKIEGMKRMPEFERAFETQRYNAQAYPETKSPARWE
jgi:hypothetical protein